MKYLVFILAVCSLSVNAQIVVKDSDSVKLGGTLTTATVIQRWPRDSTRVDTSAGVVFWVGMDTAAHTPAVMYSLAVVYDSILFQEGALHQSGSYPDVKYTVSWDSTIISRKIYVYKRDEFGKEFFDTLDSKKNYYFVRKEDFQEPK